MHSMGELYLMYVDVPSDYPRWQELSRILDVAIFDAVEDVMREYRRDDPVFRVMEDERCELWTWTRVPAGTLPMGNLIEADRYGDIYRGRLRPPDCYDLERWENRREPVGLAADWIERVHGDGPWGEPEMRADTEVDARVPVPFDMAALLAIIDRENPPEPSVGSAVPLEPPPAPTDWSRYGRCGTCATPAGEPCQHLAAYRPRHLRRPHRDRTKVRQ